MSYYGLNPLVFIAVLIIIVILIIVLLRFLFGVIFIGPIAFDLNHGPVQAAQLLIPQALHS